VNNSLKYIDPSGHCLDDACIGEAALVAFLFDLAWTSWAVTHPPAPIVIPQNKVEKAPIVIPQENKEPIEYFDARPIQQQDPYISQQQAQKQTPYVSQQKVITNN
jgi:hypothetical protein